MKWKNIKDEKEKYAAYLCSREWAEKREAVRKRANGKCERCKVNDMDAVHHLTYLRKYKELPEDLQAICNQCHDFTHGKTADDPAVRMEFPKIKKHHSNDGTGHGWGQLACPFCGSEELDLIECGKTDCGTLDSIFAAVFMCDDGHYFCLSIAKFRGGPLSLAIRTKPNAKR